MCILFSLRQCCLDQGHREGTLTYGHGERDGAQIVEERTQGRIPGMGTEIGRKKEKSGSDKEIRCSDAKICVYDNTIKNSD